MSTEPTPDAPPHHAELAHFAAAAVAAMAVVPLLACTFSLGKEPGTENWQNWLLGLLLVAGGYLLAVAFTHLGEAWRGADRLPPTLWLTLPRIAVDGAVAVVVTSLLLGGPSSRILLTGLSDALPGLAAAAAVSALIGVYSRVRESPDPGPRASGRPRRGGFHILVGLLLVAGMIACEMQPPPRVMQERKEAVGAKVVASSTSSIRRSAS